MTDWPASDEFWRRWLMTVAVGVMIFGLGLVLAPRLTRSLFGLLIYGDPAQIESFGADAVAYIGLLHAVLGAVMFGWGLALLLIFRGPFRRRSQAAWQIAAVSVLAWFVPDTAFSLWSGFWPNAVLNSVFAVLFAVPLVATYRRFNIASTREPEW